MEAGKYLDKYEVYLTAKPGSKLYNCKKEAVMFCIQNSVDTIFTHNDQRWMVKIIDIEKIVKKL